PSLRELRADVIAEPGKGWTRDEKTVVISTLHSFKGYDAEIVVVAGAERFIGEKQLLPNNLYVAMTRARSKLSIFAYAQTNPNAQKILSVLDDCIDGLLVQPEVEPEISNLDDFEDVAARIGPNQRDWLMRLWKSHEIQKEPITARDGEILAQPLFWFR